ncbi:MAG: MFS transporter [Erythrobacter sp.]|nr:MFS transporter [Erythrobacter sp.]
MSEHTVAQDIHIEKDDWRSTILAGLANYIDSGSIVSGSVALALWKDLYGLSDSFIGLIAAFSANAISAGVGAFIGGWLCDKVGRKKIYQYDMLFYAFGMLFLIFASAAWMIVLGFVLVGLAVGADIPASWSLIAEQAPDKKRGAHSAVAQVLWNLGPVVVLGAGYFLTPFGIDGVRWLFIHLAVIAVLLTFLRSSMAESLRWQETQKEMGSRAGSIDWGELFSPRYIKSLAFLVCMYGFWNLWAGYNGFFTPYLIEQNNLPQWTATVVPAAYFLLAILSVLLVFMPLSDKVDHRKLFAVSALMQVFGMALLTLFGFHFWVVIVHFLIMGLAAGFGAQSFFQLWSAELFPTEIRATAQGVAFSVVRIGLGVWSLAVPTLASYNPGVLAWILTGFLTVSAAVGWLWAPNNAGKSLEDIQREHQGA